MGFFIYTGVKMKKIYRDSHKAKGLCVSCGELAQPKKTLCLRCKTLQANSRKKTKLELKQRAVQYLGGQCADCGLQSDIIAIYDFHHINPHNKDIDPSRLLQTTGQWERAKLELDKCVLLCSNCHRIRHAQGCM